MTPRIDKYLELGQVSEARPHVEQELLRQDKSKWTSDRQAEYDVLFPSTEMVEREITQEDIDNNPYPDEPIESILVPIDIDYSEDVNYLSFGDWLVETIVTQEAVEEVTEPSEDGLTEVVLVDGVNEVSELIREYIPNDVTVGVDEFMLPHEGTKAKDEVNALIAVMTVTTQSGKEFDAHQEARVNMMSAIFSAETMNLTEVEWKLVDNTKVMVTLAELKEAVYLALAKFAQLKGIV